MAESEEELKILLKVKEESEKVGVKINIQKTKIMAFSPFTLWQIDGETVAEFILLASQISADGDLQPWNKKMFASWKKSCDQSRHHIKKQRH